MHRSFIRNKGNVRTQKGIDEYLMESMTAHKNTVSHGEDGGDSSGLDSIYTKISLNPVEKNLLSKLYIGKEFSECALGWSTDMFNSDQRCLDDESIKKLAEEEGVQGNSVDELYHNLKSSMGCDTDSCIVKDRMKSYKHLFKPDQVGKETADLVCNVYAETFLNQLEKNYPFKTMKVVCSDFMPADRYVDDMLFTEHDDSIEYLGGIYNTGTVANGGKHWIAAFIKLDHVERTIDIEYFNSSGRPHKFLKDYLDRVAEKYNEKYSNTYKITFTDIGNGSLQKNNTYCGFYSCFYILFRLFGIPAKYLNYPYIWNDVVLTDGIPKLSNKIEVVKKKPYKKYQS